MNHNHRQFLRLVMFLLLMGGLAFGLAPALKRLPLARDVFQVVDERNVDATPLFYTDWEERPTLPVNHLRRKTTANKPTKATPAKSPK